MYIPRLLPLAVLASTLASAPQPAQAAPQAAVVLPFDDAAHRNWSQDADVIYLTANAADLAARAKGAKKAWVVLSARSLLPEWWTHPATGIPEFTQRCVIAKDYDFTWIEATAVPVSSLKNNQLEVSNAKGAYYAFLVVQGADGALSSVKVDKLGDAKRNPPQAGKVAVKNGQALTRTWDDDKRPICAGKAATTPTGPSYPAGVFPLPFQDTANRNWSQDADTIYVTADAADLAARTKGASKVWVVLSARSLLPEWWTDPAIGLPKFTQKCVVSKSYDFKWIEANAVAPASIKGTQFKVDNAKGAYYAFVVAQAADGTLSSVKLSKLGDATRNPPVAGAMTVKNAQVLERTWDDDKRPLCK